MSNKNNHLFTISSEKISGNEAHRKTIQYNMGKYYEAFENGKKRYSDLEAAREKASSIKKHTLENLSKYLEKFEENFTKHGGKVLWASTSDDAIKIIVNILIQEKVTSIVKSKSMTTEEIDLNAELAKHNIESIETDLGEYIVQIAGEKPYHIVTPAMHKSKEDIATLFHNIHQTPLESSPKEITQKARELLRNKFKQAGAGITGANFLIAETGGVCVTENEGNALMSTAFPNIHIAIAGIEKVIPSMTDLALFWPHLAQHGTGQAITSYNSIFRGPKKSNELNGPQKTYVILLDNGRTNIYKQNKINLALTCIRCGACLNACPVYKTIGGHTYNSTYQGPIGSIIEPHLHNFQDYGHLSTACSLCGNCTTVCPVKIPLHDLLIENRKLAVEKNTIPKKERKLIQRYMYFMSNANHITKTKGLWKNYFAKLFARNILGKKRALPKFSKLSFREQYTSKKA